MTVVDKVGPAEVEEIKALHARKAALKELVFAMASLKPEELGAIYERVVTDLANTCIKFDTWWADHSLTAGWPKGVKLEIDFTTGDIFTRA